MMCFFSGAKLHTAAGFSLQSLFGRCLNAIVGSAYTLIRPQLE
jgi:hypothetical protein